MGELSLRRMGSGKNFSAGNFTLGNLYDTPVTISGLPFTPTKIYVFTNYASGVSFNPGTGKILVSCASNEMEIYAAPGGNGYGDNSMTYFPIVINNNGFTIRSNYNTAMGNYANNGYKWVAVKE